MDENMALTPYETREILFYKTDNGDVRVEILLYQENLWLTQAKMAELFEVQKAAISKHLKNIFASGELMEDSVVSVLETTAADGKNYPTRYYNLDAIIAVGYRVNSKKATMFRIWANRVIQDRQYQSDFLRAAADVVHAAHPFHLVGGFERFGHIFLPYHIGNDDCHTLVTGLVDLGKVPMQRSACEQVCVENGAMFFQIAAAHTPVLADLVFWFVRQRKVRDKIITLLTVSAAHFLK